MSLNNTFWMIQSNVNRYICPICLVFGLMGCSLNIYLFSQKQFVRISCCTYFLVASVVMLLALIVGLVPHIYGGNNLNPSERIVLFCKIRGYVGQSVTMMYRWLMAMACIDRYFASSNNVYLREYANPRMAYSMIRKIVVINGLLPVHNLVFLDIKRGSCINSMFVYGIYHSLFTFIVGGFLPILIMIISVILIRSNLASIREHRRRNVHCDEKCADERFNLLRIRDEQVLLMLFLQVVVYIVSTIPWMIFLLYGPYAYHLKKRSIHDQMLIQNFLKYFAEMLIYIYPTLSFYIYTLTSHTFRSALVRLLRTIFVGKSRTRYAPQLASVEAELIRTKNVSQSNKSDENQSVELKSFFEALITNGRLEMFSSESIDHRHVY